MIRVAPRIGALAARLLDIVQRSAQGDIIHVASSERRADAMGRVLRRLAPDLDVIVFPAWDCLPYDRAPPSRDVMARRAVALARLAQERGTSRILIATPDALVQRVPPRGVWSRGPQRLATGAAVSPEAVEARFLELGYVLDERVDEPGEAALTAQVIDIFPSGAGQPVRIEHADGKIEAIRAFDAVSQLTIGELEEVRLDPATEYALLAEGDGDAERWLPPPSAALESLFDYLSETTLVLDEQVEERRLAVMEQIADAYESRIKGAAIPGPVFPPPARFYLSADDWAEQLGRRETVQVQSAGGGEDDVSSAVVPSFATRAHGMQAFVEFIKGEIKAGRRVVLAAAADRELRAMTRGAAQANRRAPAAVRDWNAVLTAKPGALLALNLDLEGGFVDEDAAVTVIAAADLFGSRAHNGGEELQQTADLLPADAEFRIGDAVIHLDRGMGLLQGLERVATDLSGSVDTVRLAYADDDKLMAPIDELDRIWRYGAGDTVTLDRLEGDSWPKRRARIEAEIAETARRLVGFAREREGKSAPKLVPPRPRYDRFAARFPYSETPDQLRAIEDSLADLASGRPMDRLVCGDVGFGKTEVALRAAAAAALSGKQVAIVAPTTVLARQHLQTFRRRFSGFGIEVVHLSRLVKPAEARAVKQGLADGTVRIVIGTHALTGKDVRFADLGLVVIDEEQRFGLAHKRKLRELGSDVHVLTLTATPIPRTLQAAMLGLQDLSIIATPPAQRRPIRTVLTPFDDATLRQALLRERRRGGQSFVVCPRVEDIEPMAARLAGLVPELQVFVAHGKMPADEIDDAMVRFADGEGDVLLATNIIESGLDVPRANTMLIWRADRFGLAQLHQLRGRVGRGRVRGVAYLLTDPSAKIGSATRKRLQTLETLDRLGAGFAISARDLDARGAGDLFGEDQAGHVKLIGMGLYRHLLDRALDTAHGAAPADEWSPELNLGLAGRIPDDYVPDTEVRLNLYARLARLDATADIDTLSDEIEDRFGPQPAPVRELFLLTRLKRSCRRLGIARIDAGPQAIALAFRTDLTREKAIGRLIAASKGTLAWRGERLVYTRATEGAGERQRVTLKLVNKLAEKLA